MHRNDRAGQPPPGRVELHGRHRQQASGTTRREVLLPSRPAFHPAKESKKRAWIFGGTAVAVILVVAAVVVGVITIRGGISAGSGSSQKPDLTQVTVAMLVDQSSFPSIEGMQFREPKFSSDPNHADSPVYPSECATLLLGPNATQEASTGELNSTQVFAVAIKLTTERPDIRQLIPQCLTTRIGLMPVTIEPRSFRELPDWANAMQLHDLHSTTLVATGYCRGIYVQANTRQSGNIMSQQKIKALVKLFHDQVEKLEAA